MTKEAGTDLFAKRFHESGLAVLASASPLGKLRKQFLIGGRQLWAALVMAGRQVCHWCLLRPGSYALGITVPCQVPSCLPRREVSTLLSRGLEPRLVLAARLDELLGRAATVGVGVGHGAAEFLDGWC